MMIVCSNCHYEGRASVALDLDGTPLYICPECDMVAKENVKIIEKSEDDFNAEP